MPTYQYRCADCGHELEAVQKFTDPSLTECPSCEGNLRKVFNAVGVVFKGSGFYKTDSRTQPKADTGTSSSAPKAETSSGGTSSTANTATSSTSKKDAK